MKFIVYAKVSVALPDLEPEIVCCNQRTGKSEGMGVLQFTEATNSIMVNIQAARKALSSECVFAKGLLLCFIPFSSFLLTGSFTFSHCKTYSVRVVHWSEWTSVGNDSPRQDNISDLPRLPSDHLPH